jgi:hypothetical protein
MTQFPLRMLRKPRAVTLLGLSALALVLFRCVKIEIDPGLKSSKRVHGTRKADRPAPIRTFAADSAWERLWIAGIDDTQGIFSEPRQIIAHRSHVVVLDAATREVRVLDLRTGSVKLTMVAQGVGPGEFKRPAKLIKSPEGFAVLDHESGRLSNFTLEGALQWDFSVPDLFEVSSLCIPDRHTVAAYYSRSRDNVIHFDTAGNKLSQSSVPWAYPRTDMEAHANPSFASNVSSTMGCALSPVYGEQWAVLPAQASDSPNVYPFHEPGLEPVFEVSERVLGQANGKVAVELIQRTDAPVVAQGVQAIHDTVVINAWTTKQFPRRILDYHHLPSGRYLYSRVLPFVVNGFAIAPDGTFIVSHIGDTDQIVMAMRPVARPNSSNKSGQAGPATATPPAGTPARPPAPARARPPANR